MPAPAFDSGALVALSVVAVGVAAMTGAVFALLVRKPIMALANDIQTGFSANSQALADLGKTIRQNAQDSSDINSKIADETSALHALTSEFSNKFAADAQSVTTDQMVDFVNKLGTSTSTINSLNDQLKANNSNLESAGKAIVEMVPPTEGATPNTTPSSEASSSPPAISAALPPTGAPSDAPAQGTTATVTTNGADGTPLSGTAVLSEAGTEGAPGASAT